MWGPGLADSDAVTFFAVPLVSWLPEDKTTRNFLELIPILSLCYTGCFFYDGKKFEG